MIIHTIYTINATLVKNCLVYISKLSNLTDNNHFWPCSKLLEETTLCIHYIYYLHTIDLPGLGVSAVTSKVKLPVSRENPSVMLMPAGGLGCQFPKQVKQSIGKQAHTT